MMSILLGLALFLQLMGVAEAAIAKAPGIDPAVLCSLHPPDDGDGPQDQRRHELCCSLACAGFVHAGPALLPAAGPVLPLPSGMVLAAAPPDDQRPRLARFRTCHGARGPPFLT